MEVRPGRGEEEREVRTEARTRMGSTIELRGDDAASEQNVSRNGENRRGASARRPSARPGPAGVPSLCGDGLDGLTSGRLRGPSPPVDSVSVDRKRCDKWLNASPWLAGPDSVLGAALVERTRVASA